MKQLSILFRVLCISLVLASCSGDDDKDVPDGGNCGNIQDASEQYLESLTAYQEKLEAYKNDPSTENCQAVQKSLDSFIDAYDDFLECFGAESLDIDKGDIDSDLDC